MVEAGVREIVGEGNKTLPKKKERIVHVETSTYTFLALQRRQCGMHGRAMSMSPVSSEKIRVESIPRYNEGGGGRTIEGDDVKDPCAAPVQMNCDARTRRPSVGLLEATGYKENGGCKF